MFVMQGKQNKEYTKKTKNKKKYSNKIFIAENCH